MQCFLQVGKRTNITKKFYQIVNLRRNSLDFDSLIDCEGKPICTFTDSDSGHPQDFVHLVFVICVTSENSVQATLSVSSGQVYEMTFWEHPCHCMTMINEIASLIVQTFHL